MCRPRYPRSALRHSPISDGAVLAGDQLQRRISVCGGHRTRRHLKLRDRLERNPHAAPEFSGRGNREREHSGYHRKLAGKAVSNASEFRAGGSPRPGSPRARTRRLRDSPGYLPGAVRPKRFGASRAYDEPLRDRRGVWASGRPTSRHVAATVGRDGAPEWAEAQQWEPLRHPPSSLVGAVVW